MNSWNSNFWNAPRTEADSITDAIDSIPGLTNNEQMVLRKVTWEHHIGHHWSVAKGGTKFVMDTLGLSRKKADALLLKVLDKLDSEYKY